MNMKQRIAYLIQKYENNEFFNLIPNKQTYLDDY
jgi:hypothetical protein